MNKIKLEHDIQVSVIWYNNLDSRSFKSFSQPKWSELVNRLAIPQNNINKYARGVAIYGDMKDDTDENGNEYKKYRKDENVIYRDVLVLDYDDIPKLRILHDAITETLKGVSWMYHTTFNHRTESPRVRLYIALNEHISADEYRKYTKVLASKIGHPVDEGSYQPSRAMALPVKKSNDSIYIFKYNDAPILSVETLEEWSKELKSQYKESNKFKYPKRRDNEFWKSIAFGVSTGNRNQMLTSLIGVLLNRRVPDPLVYAYCFMWNENCNPPLSSREFNATFESIYKREHR
ncbi:primase alpha helix C-terminal domain-containing protein [Staphylococcus aureus]|uniref:primase alpha helix C-terminal domain-containing protein n=1 Tax=Staphylococcus aureus TaxID=1280 RepID=UPI0018EA1248|nr:primase alpha helix C-terminal domain-containing protein [Staphylococcus aureus]MBJ6129064.1 primase alpha helix C-terminal domain-containing protein [Staphylococcus aureus]MBJ6140324.1 primase alpha helix C-terminal domain-containing protein [Staphylococcus aureus]MBJ6159293.1 primase alpha helix C-terminal domain-containing protein [Staphylococcus aureus]MBJ6160701.1 primase alpha helix C-terminal domain-containing protein [Staphylococcus aureus]MBJ6170707.1 primase alpha helix C-terminal